MPKPILIVAILFKKRGAIGGMAQRFNVLGAHLIQKGECFELLTTQSLVSEFDSLSRKEVKVLNDNEKGLTLAGWLTALSILTCVALGKYSRVHLAGAGRFARAFLYACSISGTNVSCTFASRTLEMATYGRTDDIKKWQSLLNRADKIDVLNPGHDLVAWSSKISVSPCSFLSKIRNLPTSFSPKRSKTAVFCGAFEATKNPMLAIDVVDKYIGTSGDSIKLIMFGKGTMGDKLSQRAAEINSQYGEGTISFGNNTDLGAVLSVANVFFSLQEFDNYPSQSLLEAMLMGCKFIATDEGDTSLLFNNGEDRNSCVNSRSASDFIPAMQKAFQDTDASFINAAFAKEQHSIDRFSKYFIKFVNE